MSSQSDIQRVGICGVGQMGTAAAVCYKRAGFETILWDQNRDQVDTVEERLAELEDWMNQRRGPVERSGGIYTLAADLREIDDRADLVMDCIVEDIDEKVALFAGLSAASHREAVLITTTSGLSISELGKRSGTGPILAGTHFWNPPHLMPLVEVVRGQETRDAVLDRVTQMMLTIGKIPVRVERDVPGFVGNRLLHALWREAIYLVQAGIATPEDVDLVARMTFGLRMPAVGPLENMDLVGLDLIEKIHSYLLADLCDDVSPLPLLKDKTDRNQLGMKTGRGFYDWTVRDARQLIEKRDRQIVHQLEFLKQLEDG